ncbi:hypothetical protein, variant 2 [Puccinia triticina 1-1 BBBD Race 1]|uniref:MFS domain-containing protein n=1 Tax=Puccinia triticina (isolate 1-1 / race 1 (BBBD)) TaxID=630390 RepID=A0A180H651_PUCT1|nr:hypothetical protein PTTG_03309 [Puccinia triticina 1-1 BBBD Race 1]OAW00021.1 hypothetical protein, variant 1 [Puccinia triticina 1-1 BBBD Race 1]OAW00022.1 hypothetical protein, variant 2 [Puccinia triticina 1-1 BBBD Race 1]
MEQKTKQGSENTSTSLEIVRPAQPIHIESAPTSERRWIPKLSEAKLLIIASTGFFIDAYDLFTINLVVPLLNIQYNGKLGSKLANAALAGGVLKAATNIGCIFGQILFGTLGDVYGRKIVYPAALGVAILGTVLTIAAPNSLGPQGVFIWMTIMRILMGIGIGGDYPMSASVVSDRANINRRGLLLTFTFAMQGWGNLAGAIVCIVVLSAFKESIQSQGEIGHFNAVWRLILGVILVPALATLYQRLRLPESDRMTEVLKERKLKKALNDVTGTQNMSDIAEHLGSKEALGGIQNFQESKLNALNEFKVYFSKWKHLKHLLATTSCWFLLDLSFYGIALNQSMVIADIGYDRAVEPWQNAYDNTKANLVITIAGFLPGYYFTMFFIEYIGRKPIQVGGFLIEGLLLAIVAGDFKKLSNQPAGFLVCFILLQFFFNFGANTTTFVYPAEIFPTRVRGFASGISAAGGKIGAVIAALSFGELSQEIGTSSVLWILAGTSFLGAAISLLLPETKGWDADEADSFEQAQQHNN